MFVQSHRKYTTKSNPNVNYGLWVTMMSQYRFINCFKKKKVSLWWRMSIAGETVHVCGQGVENSVYFLLNFAMDLKLH